ncbi:MAG: hypothetical protein MJ252_00480, partial [archaeon]|nr:hypothetical protein [archaeon]
MGSLSCMPCSQEKEQKENINSDQNQIETAVQITIDRCDILTTQGKNNLISSSDNKIIPKAYDIYGLKALMIQKIWRGRKKRKEFRDHIELINNILTLDCTSMKNTNISEIVLANKGNIVSKRLAENNLITEHVFEKKEPNKYLVQVPLSYIDKSINEDLYEGTMTLDKVRSGYGILYSQGCKYEGNWEKDKLNGYSRIFLAEGDFYEGNLENGIASGYGKFIHEDGNIYEGFWMNDKPHGRGKEIYSDHSVFEGEFLNGEKVNGKLSWPDGSYYVGKIKDNLFEGEGLFHWAEGREYKGTWKGGKMDGTGRMN